MDRAPSLRLLSQMFLLALLVVPLAGCEVVEGIFKAGMFVGILAVVLVVGIVGFLIAKMRA